MKDLKRSISHAASHSLVVAIVAGCIAIPAQAADSIKRPFVSNNSNLHLQRLNARDLRVDVFVQLDEPSVSELNIDSVGQTGEIASADAQKAQAQRVVAQQNTIRPSLESYGAKIISSHRVGANGLHISVALSEVNALRGLPGVRSIGRVATYKPDNIDSVPWVGAPKVWNTFDVKGNAVKGKNVKVGIIDSGIDYMHADFGGSGNVADFNANDPNVVEPGSFPTAKVVGGYDFAGGDYDANDSSTVAVPDADPIDHSGHGTHVAGTVAGIGVPGMIGAGVAPEASLYALKVFGDGGGSTRLTSEAIEWAMDPNGDGDMSDHLDVINMSLGTSFGDPNDPTAISAANAAALGIIVVASAGNAGAVPYVTGSPAIASAAISVAASTPGGRVYPKVQVTAPASVAGVYESLEGSGPVQLIHTGPISGALVNASPLNGCSALTNAAAIAGKIALIVRGACAFIDKYHAAQAAGAKAVVVFNDGADSTRLDPIIMSGLDNTVTIAGVMISFGNGKLLSQTTGVSLTLKVVPDPAKDDQIVDFSSKGPGNPDSSFKPDLAAPGDSIVSAGFGTGIGSANFSGTSMAAPHVTGAAALLHQMHPKLNPSAIKALLQNSTVNANASGDTKLTRQGVGVIRIDKAATLTSYASPAGISFGRLNPVFPVAKTEEIKLTSLSNAWPNTWRRFSGKLVQNHSLPGVTVSCPTSISVFGKRPSEARITLKFDPAVTAKANIADDGLSSQIEVDGWCVFNDGKDELRVGYIAVVDPASSVFVTPGPGLHKVTVRNLGPAMGWAEAFTLAKLGGEQLDHASNAISAVGFRRADASVFGGDVLELAVATEQPFTHISNLIYDIYIDTNDDGTSDVEMLAVDYSLLNPDVDPGTFVTAQFDLNSGDGFIDWKVLSWDYNDNTAILPFSLLAYNGLVPEKFGYELHLINNADNSEDVQHGKVDLSKSVVPDLNSFGVGARDKIEVNMSGKGTTLWLFQNNPAQQQTGLSFSK